MEEKEKMKLTKECIGSMSVENFVDDIVSNGLSSVRKCRKCCSLSDEDFMRHGIMRVFDETSSGREFLQKIFDYGIMGNNGEFPEEGYIAGSTYFGALCSRRRLEFTEEISIGIFRYLTNMIRKLPGVDYLSQLKELKGRSVFSGDGHYINAAVHTEKIKGKTPVPGCIYVQDLVSGFIYPLCQVESEISPKPHEIKFLKKYIPCLMNLGNGNGSPILIYDRAATDNKLWSGYHNIRRRGITIITRTKENMRFVHTIPLEFKKNDPVNEGVTGYYLCGVSNGGVLYTIHYTDPESGKKFIFLTNDKSLRPGVVALLYKLRWKIEKVFDVSKNKFYETKAWATSLTAHRIQSLFIALTYNITFFFRIVMDKIFNIRDEVSEQKRKKRIEHPEQSSSQKNSDSQQTNRNSDMPDKKHSSSTICHFISSSHIHQIPHRIIRFIRNIYAACKSHLTIFQIIPALQYHMKLKLPKPSSASSDTT